LSAINIKNIFSLVLAIIGIILVLFLTYYGTKWLSKKSGSGLRSKYMNITDRMMLGQNKFLAIAEISGKYYLLGVTENNISILKELEDFQPLPAEAGENPEFDKILSKFIKKTK